MLMTFRAGRVAAGLVFFTSGMGCADQPVYSVTGKIGSVEIKTKVLTLGEEQRSVWQIKTIEFN